MKEQDVTFVINSLNTLKQILGSDLFTVAVLVGLAGLLYYGKLYFDKNFEKKKSKSDNDDDSTQFKDTVSLGNSAVNNSGNSTTNINLGTPTVSHNNEHDSKIDGLELANKLTYSNIEFGDKYHEAKQMYIDELVKNNNLNTEISILKNDLRSIHRMLITFSIKENTRREYDTYIKDIVLQIESKIPELRIDRKRKERARNNQSNDMGGFEDSDVM